MSGPSRSDADMEQPANSDDRLLGGRLRLTQPKYGYRVAIDPILLAAAIDAGPGERVLDAGCGTGAAALCLATRVLECTITGVERDAELAALARANVTANALDGRISVVQSALEAYSGVFDRVMTNPPFYEADTHTRSPQATKASAHGETALDLSGWIKTSARLLKPGGRLTLIHRADRLGDIMRAFEGRFGAAAIFPFWPREGVEAKRILVTAIKGRRTLPRLLPGLTLHKADGAYTMAAEAILRDAAALDLGLGSS